MSMTIYTMTHKPFVPPPDRLYQPLQVGSALHESLGYLSDNEGDNISEQNPYYSELTGHYWVWKNDKHSDYVGCSDHRCRTAGHRRCIWQMDGETVRRSRAGGNADADLCRGRGNGVDLHGHWHHLPRLILVQIYRLIIATAVFPQICLLVSGLFT